MLALAVLAAVAAIGAAVWHWSTSDRGHLTTAPEFGGLVRSVQANDLVSPRDPALVLRFDPGFRYLGGQKFVLYGLADAEQHFFVQTTGDDKLKSLYWVQFEAFLPDNTRAYDYEHSPLRVRLGDHEFYTDTSVVAFDPQRKRAKGTDGAMARQFLASKGYVLPADWAYARLVYLTDTTRRKELMIIFIDDLSPQGLTAAALEDGGALAARRSDVERAHLDKIRRTLTVLPLPAPN